MTPATQSKPADVFRPAIEAPQSSLPEVLFEQLDYLIRFADQEPDRLERVKAILMETFN